jgi:ribonuclease BN (tRNA processing enzyme)
VPALAAGADLFLSEAAFLDAPDLPPDLHLTARQAAAYATKANVGRLVLTHLQPWYTADDAREEAATAFTGPLDIAKAGQALDV